MSPQKKIFSDLTPEKGIDAIACNACCQKSRDPSACRSLFLTVFSHGGDHRIPMQSQVQRHQNVIQIGTDQMVAVRMKEDEVWKGNIVVDFDGNTLDIDQVKSKLMEAKAIVKYMLPEFEE
jgi:hypothetical protein